MNTRPHTKYVEWKDQNPDIILLFETYALRFLKQRRRFSVRDILQHIRWHEYFEGTRDTPYRISDHHSPYIARDLVRKYPAMLNYIRMKTVREERAA